MPSSALGDQREIDHHDGVLLHNADQKNDADHRDQAEVGFKEEQSQQVLRRRRKEAWRES